MAVGRSSVFKCWHCYKKIMGKSRLSTSNSIIYVKKFLELQPTKYACAQIFILHPGCRFDLLICLLVCFIDAVRGQSNLILSLFSLVRELP